MILSICNGNCDHTYRIIACHLFILIINLNHIFGFIKDSDLSDNLFSHERVCRSWNSNISCELYVKTYYSRCLYIKSKQTLKVNAIYISYFSRMFSIINLSNCEPFLVKQLQWNLLKTNLVIIIFTFYHRHSLNRIIFF